MPDKNDVVYAMLGIALLMACAYFLSVILDHIGLILLLLAGVGTAIYVVRRRNLRSF